MLIERGLDAGWVKRVLAEPAKTEVRDDGTIHYLKPISEHGGRVLRVVTDAESQPLRVITVFFDRRARRKT